MHNEPNTTVKERILHWMHLTGKPSLKVYQGFGDKDTIVLYGHVLGRAALPQMKYKKWFWNNAKAFLRLFMVKPLSGINVSASWQQTTITTPSQEDGFFKLEWKPYTPPSAGMHEIGVSATLPDGRRLNTTGTFYVPHSTQYAFISDIDDTFLVSHSSKLAKRLYLLFTRNAHSRQPFDGVVRHYQLLAQGNTTTYEPNPFFYVSSSEWNLYDYIKSFCQKHGMPDGVFLLNTLKRWQQVFTTAQNNHSTKFTRIARLLVEYPHRTFVLLGDDSQQDPIIYKAIVEQAHGRIKAVYIRQVERRNRTNTQATLAAISQLGIHTCYFARSLDAIQHSRSIGLIGNA